MTSPTESSDGNCTVCGLRCTLSVPILVGHGEYMQTSLHNSITFRYDASDTVADDDAVGDEAAVVVVAAAVAAGDGDRATVRSLAAHPHHLAASRASLRWRRYWTEKRIGKSRALSVGNGVRMWRRQRSSPKSWRPSTVRWWRRAFEDRSCVGRSRGWCRHCARRM